MRSRASESGRKLADWAVAAARPQVSQGAFGYGVRWATKHGAQVQR